MILNKYHRTNHQDRHLLGIILVSTVSTPNQENTKMTLRLVNTVSSHVALQPLHRELLTEESIASSQTSQALSRSR